MTRDAALHLLQLPVDRFLWRTGLHLGSTLTDLALMVHDSSRAS